MSEKWPNYYAFTGDKAGNLWITILGSPSRLVRQAPASGEIPWYVVDELVIDLVAAGIDPATISDAFKNSGVRRLRIGKLVVRTGGKVNENAFDANFEGDEVEIGYAGGIELEEGRQNAVTIKGGCTRYKLWNGVVNGRGGHCDIELGNRSDQSTRKTRDVSLINWSHADRAPLRLRVEQAEWPFLLGSSIHYQGITSGAILAWLWARDPRYLREYFFGKAA